MLVDIFQVAVLLAYAGALVLLFLAGRSDEHSEKYTRIAAVTGIALGVITLVGNLLFVTGPDLALNINGRYVLLVVIAAIVPVITMAGGIQTLLQRRFGVGLLITGLSLWLAYSVLGLLTAYLL